VNEPGELIVGVGSLRGPKLTAVERALRRLAPVDARLAAARVVGRDVGEVAPAMPLSVAELLEGARSRAERVLELLAAEHCRAGLGVGLEGGLEILHEDGTRRGFLMGWAYVTDGSRGAHGCGGALELPSRIVEEVVDDDVELGVAIDHFSGESDVRSGQGAWGILTRGLVERSDSFEVAVLNALAPFYNTAHYQ